MTGRLPTLRKRSEFQRVRGGGRAQCGAFVLEGKRRPPPATPGDDGKALGRGLGRPPPIGPRFGFTITRKLGNAVTRNRMRRRLKAAFLAAMATDADPTTDYVVIARPPAETQPFASLAADVVRALRTVNAAGKRHDNAARPKPAATPPRPPGR